MKALCFTWKRPFLTVMLVLLFFSCVELVTLAVTCPWLSVSMMMRFFDSCSWMRMTFSVPCNHVEFRVQGSGFWTLRLL